MARFCILALPVLVIALGACGSEDDPGPIDSTTITTTINSMNGSDIDPPGIIEKDENISNETGNPWGEFIKAAEAVCGRTPQGFEVLSASVALDEEDSRNVDTLEDVITGRATVYFASTRGSDPAALRVTAASAPSVSGPGPVSMGGRAGPQDLAPLHERLVGGDFHVGFRGETDRQRGDDFSMNLRIQMRVRAYCQ